MHDFFYFLFFIKFKGKLSLSKKFSQIWLPSLQGATKMYLGLTYILKKF